jgi:UDP-glucose 4-epimerase
LLELAMKILVTGGAGFIGSHVAEAYVAAGHEVHVLDDLSHGRRENVPSSVPLHVLDVRSAQVRALLQQERFNVVNHHAAQIDVRRSVEDPVLDAELNIMGSLNLLQACREAGVAKFIFASSGGAVYGEPRYLPVDEDHPIEPVSPYGLSKYVVEQYVRLFAALSGMRYVILRYPNVYGPRQDPLGEAGVVAIFAARMLAGRPVCIYGSGEQERDFLHVRDCARANVLALERGECCVLNLGTAQGTSINALFSLMAGLTGYSLSPVYRPARPGETMRMALSYARARALLGWEPRVPLAEGLRETVEAMRQVLPA